MATEDSLPDKRPALFGSLPRTERLKNRIPKPGDSPEKPRLPPDALIIKAQWERAQKNLERTQVLHQREAEQDKARLERLHEALQAAADAGPEDVDHTKRNRALAGVGMAFLMVAGVLGIAKFAHMGTGPAPFEAATVASGSATADTAGVGEFSQGMDRLTRAFNRFPGVDPETIMRKVNQKAAAAGVSVCAFAWNDGQPAIQLGDGHGGKTSLSGSLSQCADAVERF